MEYNFSLRNIILVEPLTLDDFGGLWTTLDDFGEIPATLRKNFTLSLRATMSSGLVIYTAPNVDEARRRRRAQQSTLAKRRRVSQYKKEQTASCSVVSPSAAEVCARAAEVCARRVHPPVQCARAAEVCARRVHSPVQAVAARTLRPALHRAEALPGACIVSDDMPMLLRALMSIKLRTNDVEMRQVGLVSITGVREMYLPSFRTTMLPQPERRGLLTAAMLTYTEASEETKTSCYTATDFNALVRLWAKEEEWPHPLTWEPSIEALETAYVDELQSRLGQYFFGASSVLAANVGPTLRAVHFAAVTPASSMRTYQRGEQLFPVDLELIYAMEATDRTKRRAFLDRAKAAIAAWQHEFRLFGLVGPVRGKDEWCNTPSARFCRVIKQETVSDTLKNWYAQVIKETKAAEVAHELRLPNLKKTDVPGIRKTEACRDDSTAQKIGQMLHIDMQPPEFQVGEMVDGAEWGRAAGVGVSCVCTCVLTAYLTLNMLTPISGGHHVDRWASHDIVSRDGRDDAQGVGCAGWH